jgi:polyphosphate kinase
MERNLHHRVETLVPILDKKIKRFIKNLLLIQLNDNVKARIIDSKKTNQYMKTDSDLPVRSQLETYYFIKRAIEYNNIVEEQQNI